MFLGESSCPPWQVPSSKVPLEEEGTGILCGLGLLVLVRCSEP